ncbi:MAG TPA: serine hydrolase [archaeon]|nr:serine hydrolase [archaeon]
MKKTGLATAAFISFSLTFLLLPEISLRADTFTWHPAPPESQGMDSTKLALMSEELASRGTKGLLVIRRDRIVYEWYAPGRGPQNRHYTASLAKALVGGISLLLALNDSRLEVDDLAYKFIPAWGKDPLKRKITIRHLATHSSGIEDAETPGKSHFEQTGWKLRFWQQDPDPFSMAVYEAPVIYEPGQRYEYSNPGMGALAYAVTSSFKGSPWKDIRTLLRERIMDRIGVPENEWSMGYGATFEVDGLELCPNWGGGDYTARAVALVGRLMLRKGNWEGKQLVDSAWVERMVSYAGTPIERRTEDDANPASGLCWYTNYDGVWENVPRDAFAGAGAGNQVLLVVPSLDLIAVRNGSQIDTSNSGSRFWGGIEKYLFNPVMDAIIRPPCPGSRTILGVRFAPEEKIIRRAEGSDNWPITWAADSNLYTAYGDGWGFEPKTGQKLSNGLARISGPGSDFLGENIRSPDGEALGDGPSGAKASGMLIVDGTLYMLLRNLDNSQLAWSENHGRNWNFGFKFTTSFGCPTFLNFGPDYQGARDGYIYLYSQDGPSAYENYDQVVLARVPRDRIRERSAYQFFKGTDSGGRPIWSPDINEHKAVFSFPGHCHRLDVVYNPGLKRYLMALAANHNGAWGIFDAPEPWGPWTTAFFTDCWGLGDTHGYRIPSKWIAPDGKSFYLVFSGRPYKDTTYDAFCVRHAVIETSEK